MPDLPPTTSISHSDAQHVFVRGADLVEELIGHLTFTEMFYFELTGRRPTRGQTALLDAVMVTLMEHGLTPSAIATRLIYHSAPENLQGAVAAGLLGVGSTFIGTMEGCAALLEEIRAAPEGMARRARAVAERHRQARQPVHGFGHPFHKPDDPRSVRLLALAEEHGLAGSHVQALRVLAQAVDEAYGRHLTINATGASAALLGEIGLPQPILRGVAVTSRAAGLVGHILEERNKPAARHIWHLAETGVPYVEDPGSP
jgi:citrate synthase